jgi:hypothetical protein
MDEVLRRLLDLAYLLEPEPGPLGPLLPLYALAGLLLGVGWVWSGVKARPDASPALRMTLWALCSLGLILTLARFAGIPFLSMRLLFYGVLLAAAGVALAGQIGPSRRAALWERLRDAVAFRFDPTRQPLPWGLSLALLALHLPGLLLTLKLLGQPVHNPILAIVLLLLPQVLLWPRLHRPAFYVEALTPILLAYIVLALHLGGLVLWRALDRGSAGLRLPPPWATILDPGPYLLLGLVAALAYDLYMLAVAWGRDRSLLRYGGTALLIVGLGWAAWITFSARTHGVTGSDPYAYVQMAVDLAERGSPFHIFPLARTVQALGLPVKPALPLGYRPPFDAAGHSATVWPPGHSVLLALAYRLLGEPGLYLATPFLGLLSLAATWGLAQAVFATHPPAQRQFIGGLAVFLLATSFEHISRTVVPLADISAQLFTALTLTLALEVYRRGHRGAANRRTYLMALLLGLSFGLAYAVRYTQLLLAPSILLALVRWTSPPAPPLRGKGSTPPLLGKGIGGIGLFALAALLVALPDLWYHQVAFGSPFRTGSEELERFALANVVPVTLRVGAEALAAREFLFFAPFIALGLWALWREDRRLLVILLIGPLAVLLFHLPYGYLRLRDLLSLFPLGAALAGRGLLEIIADLGQGGERRVTGNRQRPSALSTPLVSLAPARTAIFLLAVALPVARLALAWPATQGFYTFGTLLPPQRAALSQMAALTPPQAVIGCSLNAGAVELYARRAAFRPAAWTPEELRRFVQAMHAAGRPVYLLDDGVELHVPRQVLAETYRLTPLAALPLPYFFTGGGSENRDVILYEVRE